MEIEISEEQKAEIEERRQRSDKISRLMGTYLLKRYKMLGETCHVCKNILLQSPQGVKYCVNCEEAEKVPSAQQCQVNSNQVVNPGLRPDVPKVNLEQVECVLLTKLHAAASVLQETNSTDITIHHCHVITACSKAILAVRKLSATATPPINAHQ